MAASLHYNLWLLLLQILIISALAVLTLPMISDNDDDDDDDSFENDEGLPLCLVERDDDCLDELMHPEIAEEHLSKYNTENVVEVEPQKQTQHYWLQQGLDYVKQKNLIWTEQLQKNDSVAKNLVLMIGDGMGLATIFATRVYLGGEHVNLAFEQFPDTGLARTYALDRLIPDSAATATALMSGVKTHYGTLGLRGHVQRGDCLASRNTSNHLDSIASWALRSGKSVGLVTTSSVTDATPAALYAHTADRKWENDMQVKRACGDNSGVEDIASQLLSSEVGSQLSVILGGGRSHFISGTNGKRSDHRNLIDEFLREPNNIYVRTREELLNLKNNLTMPTRGCLLGLFSYDNLNYQSEVSEDKQPTLTEMTEIAIELLSHNPNGYLLLVEGGLIDKAHHATQARRALQETAEFSRAVGQARSQTNIMDTLIIVTADHSHTLSISGYAQHSNDIFDITHSMALDLIPYQTLSYAGGPGAEKFSKLSKRRRRPDPRQLMQGYNNDEFPATVPLRAATHDAEDVPVYASGPWSQLFSGVFEQSTVTHLMAYAACLGEGLKACNPFEY